MDKRITPPALIQASRKQRNNPTPAEEHLWQHLRREQLGVKFRRQQVIEQYIVDFYCHPARLVIEVDGSIHDQPDVHIRDLDRQARLESLGYTVLRFANAAIWEQLEDALTQIRAHLPAQTPP